MDDSEFTKHDLRMVSPFFILIKYRPLVERLCDLHCGELMSSNGTEPLLNVLIHWSLVM